MLTPMACGRSVTVLRSAASSRDVYGNDTRTETPVAYTGCAVLTGSSIEDDYGRTGSDVNCTVVLPDGAVVSFTDRVRLDDGTTWNVEGQPQQQLSQLTGARGGVWVHLRKVTG